MTDSKLRCAMVYRLESGGNGLNPIVLASLDHANTYESHGGAADEKSLYGGKGGDYAKAVSKVIAGDPPGGLAEGGKVGGFKVVQSDQHQVVYGADKDGICKFSTGGIYFLFDVEACWVKLGCIILYFWLCFVI